MPRHWRAVSKYRNKPTVVRGRRFPSLKEARRYEQLALMAEAGLITDLALQVRYHLAVNGHKICDYIADFVYRQDDREIVEDCKGYRTPEYKLKKKLMFAVHNIHIWET